METTPLIDRLVEMFPGAKKTTLREMLSSRRVLINGAVAKSLKQPTTKKDKLEVLDLAGAQMRVSSLSDGLKLVHFDGDIVIVEKPSGLLTSTDPKEKRPTVLRILTEYFQRQNSKNNIHLVHRLDRDASGLLVFARTGDALHSLKHQFFEHTINRQYDAIVNGVPKKREARLEHLLLEDERTGIVHVTHDIKTGKAAILDYKVLQTNAAKTRAHLRCTLFTGRKHQIRVQMKAIGHSVCSDPLYGKADEPPHRLALHACHLTLVHPRSKRKVTFDSPMPGSFGSLIRG